jgi:hypothetical protein
MQSNASVNNFGPLGSSHSLLPSHGLWIIRIDLAQKLDAVQELGQTGGDVVIAVEPNCDCFGGLCVGAGDGDAVGSETLLGSSKWMIDFRTKGGFWDVLEEPEED